MVTVTAKIKVKPGSEAAFEQASREMVAYVKAEEPDTHTYLFHRAAKDPTTFLFFERYVDRAALDKHGQSPQMAKMFGAIGSLLDGPPTIEMYQEIDGKHGA